MDGDLDRVTSLVRKGIDPNLRDSAGYTALVCVCVCVRVWCIHPDVYLNYPLCVSPQHYASRSGHLHVCTFLLENGACASPQTPGGATPLHRSAYCGHLDVVRLLLQHRADPTLCDDDGASPLHKVKIFGMCGVPLRCFGSNLCSRFCWCEQAAERDRLEVCRLLLQVCPALCSRANKRLQLPYQLAPQQGDLQELLKPPP